MKKCEYFGICPHARKESTTCMNHGGDYCGQYRTIANKMEKGKKYAKSSKKLYSKEITRTA